MLKLLRSGLLALLAMMSVPALATAESPHQVVQVTIDQVLGELNTRREVFRKDPELFYRTLDDILTPAIDFEGFVRGVMTVRYSRQASAEQLQTFQETFKRSLMKFYGNALLEYQDQEIRMLPVAAERDPARASVNMEIVGSNGAVYPLTYTMELKGERWKVRNVIVNGINIGKLFRDQFAEAMRNNRNNLDQVIATWGDTVARSRQSVEAQAGAR
ncbi:ABC transporter substrate-binding protein [Pseudomonas sp. NW5]|uniref:MlaC/ttg2D family ABC transporter substrate-binding protein n=1 Tax=Pseudomonas sp. NW5 TaxID=2934934 RepID=UPI00202056D1|nr:ABC transporter substrate-binding protein [Pseudomonas sp. NW5]MCL7461486.1 ABC transporter substrate-binding protein [Pseudomonas sp. NW5]